jgi:hypothetical protein
MNSGAPDQVRKVSIELQVPHCGFFGSVRFVGGALPGGRCVEEPLLPGCIWRSGSLAWLPADGLGPGSGVCLPREASESQKEEQGDASSIGEMKSQIPAFDAWH